MAKITTKESLQREFLCRKCNSWVYNTRDLIIDERNTETGVSYRKFVCFTCGEVFEFTGQRYLNWRRIGKDKDKKKRITKIDKAILKLKELGLSEELSESVILAFTKAKKG